MMKRSVLFAAALAVVSVASQTQANFTVNLSNLNPTTLGSSPGTSYDFAIPAASQTSAGNFASPFNVINVGEPTASGTGSGMTMLSENVSITGDAGTLTGTLSGTFSYTGALSMFSGSFSTASTSGAGYTITGISYTQPSAGSSAINRTGTTGNISFVVTPNAVPEPASVAMLGMGLIGVGVAGYRRRMAR